MKRILNKSNRFLIILVFSHLLITSSCSIKKQVTTQKSEATIEQAWKSIVDHNILPCRMAITGDIDVKSPEENASASYDMRLAPDSLVVVSVKKFGLEIARLKVDQNDYTLLYRFESAYEQKPLSDLKSITKLDLDFDDLQHLLMANIIVGTTIPKSMQIHDGKYVLESKSDDLAIKYFLNQDNLAVAKVSYIDKMKRLVNIDFDDYKKVANLGQKVAHKRTIEVIENNNSLATITIECQEILPKDNRTIKFSIPAHYERI
jgi:hypothetical protein